MNLNKQTLSEQIYQILRTDILSQSIPCGSKLTLKMLQERFGVSSTPIREALTRLIDEQLITYYSNVGVSVVSLDQEDIHEIYHFMGDLDSLAIHYASQFPDQEQILEKLEENLSLTKNCAYTSPQWQEYSDQFHLLFYCYCQNSRLVHSAERMRSQMSIMAYQYEKQPQIQKAILKEHQEIFGLYQSRQYDEAAALMKEHLLHSLAYAEEILSGVPASQ
ncbi:MAG: GntR family transcriptional regulator [Blautia sp.]|jgi:DNA-binding GntR family transcriptional regulator